MSRRHPSPGGRAGSPWSASRARIRGLSIVLGSPFPSAGSSLGSGGRGLSRRRSRRSGRRRDRSTPGGLARPDSTRRGRVSSTIFSGNARECHQTNRIRRQQILWSTEPTLRSNEEGTEKKSRRYIHERASYLPIKQGGGGIMHWASHCEAFYAQWMIRYLGQTQISPNILRNMPCRLGERNFPKYPLSGGWSSTRPPKTEPPSPSFYDLEVGNVQFSSPAAR